MHTWGKPHHGIFLTRNAVITNILVDYIQGTRLRHLYTGVHHMIPLLHTRNGFTIKSFQPSHGTHFLAQARKRDLKLYVRQ